MRHRKSKLKAETRTSRGKMLQKSLTASLILHGKIITTEKKAKLAQSLVSKIITISKKADLNSKRQIRDLLRNKEAEKKVYSELGKKYKDKPSGYTRVLKLNKRSGDNASMVQIELI